MIKVYSGVIPYDYVNFSTIGVVGMIIGLIMFFSARFMKDFRKSVAFCSAILSMMGVFFTIYNDVRYEKNIEHYVTSHPEIVKEIQEESLTHAQNLNIDIEKACMYNSINILCGGEKIGGSFNVDGLKNNIGKSYKVSPHVSLTEFNDNHKVLNIKMRVIEK